MLCGRLLAARAPHSIGAIRVTQARITATMATAATGFAGRGAFILFEGVDRSGKSTQAAKLVEALTSRGVAAELWRFPDRETPLGKTIDAYLKGEHADDAAIHRLFSDNRWEKRDAMLRKLYSGFTLVVDRYAYSGVAYTAAKRVAGLTREWCEEPDKGLPAPDVVFYLRLQPEAAAARSGFGEERYEVPEFQRRVQECFEEMFAQGEGMGAASTGSGAAQACVTLDASCSIEELHAQVLQRVEAVLQDCRAGAPVKALWDRAPLPYDAQSSANNTIEA